MTGGTEFTEAEVQPQKEQEVQEQPKEAAEVKEVAEQAEKTKEIVETPEAVVEKGDFQAAENLEEAFKAAVLLQSRPLGTVPPPEHPGMPRKT